VNNHNGHTKVPILYMFGGKNLYSYNLPKNGIGCGRFQMGNVRGNFMPLGERRNKFREK